MVASCLRLFGPSTSDMSVQGGTGAVIGPEA